MSGRRNERGMTLIEVLVALSILAVALLALAPLFTISVKTNVAAHQLTNANTLAREKLEELSGYPRSDTRLKILDGSDASGPTGTAIITPSVATVGACDPVVPAATPPRTWCDNDLPLWFQPATGKTSYATTSPGASWFSYPYARTYTIEQFDGTLTNRITAPGAYVVKLVTVRVRPTSGPFPGLRTTTQSLYLRLRNA